MNLKSILAIAITSLVAAACAPDLEAQRTTRGRLKPARKTSHPVEAVFDTVACAADTVPAFVFSGYEKTLTASKETFFVTNCTDREVSRLKVTILYFDLAGHNLHQRDVDIDALLPPHQTRRIDVRSWDPQRVFYYRLSPMPRTPQATPYLVDIKLIAALSESKQ